MVHVSFPCAQERRLRIGLQNKWWGQQQKQQRRGGGQTCPIAVTFQTVIGTPSWVIFPLLSVVLHYFSHWLLLEVQKSHASNHIENSIYVSSHNLPKSKRHLLQNQLFHHSYICPHDIIYCETLQISLGYIHENGSLVYHFKILNLTSRKIHVIKTIRLIFKNIFILSTAEINGHITQTKRK